MPVIGSPISRMPIPQTDPIRVLHFAADKSHVLFKWRNTQCKTHYLQSKHTFYSAYHYTGAAAERDDMK